MTASWWKAFKSFIRFREYQPQPVTIRSFSKWISQFAAGDRKLILNLLDSIIYMGEKQVRDTLLRKNQQLLNKLHRDKVPAKNIVYIQIDDPGSSSPVVLNFLRYSAGLEKRGCTLIDSKNVAAISEVTSDLGMGAIVYVDDFVGTGDQFGKVRDFIAPYIVGTFSEFLLTAAICEEGIHQLGKVGVEPISGITHLREERPLHEFCSSLDNRSKQRLFELTKGINTRCYYEGLGYKRAATMVVLFSNAPDSLPLIFRGSPDQTPFVGIFPRFSDLPLSESQA